MRSDSVIPVGIRQIERCMVAVTGTRKFVVRYQRTKRKGEKGKERVTNTLPSVYRPLHVMPGLSMATYIRLELQCTEAWRLVEAPNAR